MQFELLPDLKTTQKLLTILNLMFGIYNQMKTSTLFNQIKTPIVFNQEKKIILSPLTVSPQKYNCIPLYDSIV